MVIDNDSTDVESMQPLNKGNAKRGVSPHLQI